MAPSNGAFLPGLSIVSAVRDVERARAAVGLWSSDAAVDEIVLVDLGGTRRLAELGVLGAEKTVTVVTGRAEPWARGLALNLGVAAARYDTVLVMELGDELRGIGRYLEAMRARSGFVTGFGTEKMLASDIAMFRRPDWESVGGCHEFLLGWGFEDEDLFNRLDDAGVMHRFFAAADFGTAGVADAAPVDVEIELPPGLAGQRWFQNNRNKILAGLAPWNAAMAALRPRRFGRPSERMVTCDLAPRTPLERRLQDCASYLAARFLHDVPETVAFPMLRRMMDDRAEGYAARAARQRQIDLALDVTKSSAPGPQWGQRPQTRMT